ncbi:CHAT domain-containing protein [Phormidium tenue FACHB-886]|nr:CHAT domain-containing protein [Phormidium tenue FACHB-886]
MTQEFHISVTPVGSDDYLVRTEQVAPGVPLAEEQLTWQVEEWLTQARQLMSDPLLGVLQGGGLQGDRILDIPGAGNPAPGADASSLSLINLGQQLFSALFQGTLRDSWVTAQGIAQNRREALRLRLGLKGTRLPRLPWEVMYGNDAPIERVQQTLSAAARPLAAGTHVIFSRYQPTQRVMGDRLPPPINSDQPLRILMVIAAPDDQERLQLHQEAVRLQQELYNTSPQSNLPAYPPQREAMLPEIQLTILDQPGREQLTQALEQGHYQVLHYSGHSDLSSAGGSLYLVNHRTGLTEILSGDDLAGLLVNNGVRLAVFNSCRGASAATADPVNERERNLAEALVSRGIPAVLAMAEQIPDSVALTLTWLFYRNLKQGYPIDLSLSRARQGLISAYGSHQLYWALPILYLHPEFDGYLTAVDRSFENPADRLVFMPQSYSSFPALTLDERTPLPASFVTDDSHLPTDEELVANAVLAEDELVGENVDDWIEELENFDNAEAQEEETLDWIRQLTSQVSEESITDAGQLSLDEDDLQNLQPPAETAQPMLADSDRPTASVGGVTSAITLFNESHDLSTAEQTASAGMVQALPVDSRNGNVSSRRRGILLPAVGAVATFAVLFFAFTLSQSLHPMSKNPDSPQTATPGATTPTESFSEKLAANSTAEVRAIALSSFSKKQVAQGQQAVAVLLDRNALAEAKAALAAVPKEYQNDAETQFLQGRLAWQGVKQRDPQYKLADVQRAWENAAQAEPNTVPYHQALGFAYYAGGDASRARQTWMQSIALLNSGQATVANRATMDQQMLTAYAGVALALQQVSANQPIDEQQNIASKTTKIYQMVVASDPDSFQPQALSQNWLWNEAAIQGWKKLAQGQL